MASKIEWTDATWNPVVGCQIVSPGCTNCYAMKMAGRLEAMGTALHYAGTTQKTKAGAVWTGKIAAAPDKTVFEPLLWRRPRRIFVNSMGDLFADGVPIALVDQVFATMLLTPQHQYQLLTKRAGEMRDYVRDLATPAGLERLMFTWVWHPTGRHQLIDLVDPVRVSRVLSNVWLGVSVENQLYAHSRRGFLRDVADLGWNTFVSYEPALGPVDWTGWEFLKWLICGGESGPDARPMHPDWARAARDFCEANRILFFFKQWGAWRPRSLERGSDPDFNTAKGRAQKTAAFFLADDGTVHCFTTAREEEQQRRQVMLMVGKKRAGRLLDGVEHNAMPEAYA